MDGSRDYDQVVGPSLWRRENRVPLLAISLLAALLGGAIAYFRLAGDSGDEPPIRVKNGSMEFHVLGNDKWKQKDKGKADDHWVMKGEKDRVYDDIQITAVYNGDVFDGDGAPCKSTASGVAVHLVFSKDNERVIARVVDKRTQIRAAVPGSLSGEDKKLLEYTGDGYIAQIWVEDSTSKQTSFCNFTSKEQLTHLLLLDYQN